MFYTIAIFFLLLFIMLVGKLFWLTGGGGDSHALTCTCAQEEIKSDKDIFTPMVSLCLVAQLNSERGLNWGPLIVVKLF